MRSVHELFKTDFPRLLNTETVQKMADNGTTTEFPIRLHYDFDGNSKFLSCYLPRQICTSRACEGMVRQHGEILELFANNVEVSSGHDGEKLTHSKSLRFSGRIFIYHEEDFRDGIERIREFASAAGIEFQFRGPHYAECVTANECPLAFISHDSRDKEKLVKPIVHELLKLRCPVWYDEYSLMPGDPLRESIDKGLRDCSKCVVFLTPRFLSNRGWTKAEYDSVFSLEMLHKQRRIIPVWHRVTPKSISNYSTHLLTVNGILAKQVMAQVVKELYRVLTAERKAPLERSRPAGKGKENFPVSRAPVPWRRETR